AYAISASATALPVPEPETYALLAAGLGVIGFVASRRRRDL
ncbi:MAG: PEP-CTERM sorting domain-containing protein, partial [Burkholderiales bacterium]